MEPEVGKRPPMDNLTLIIVDLQAYYNETLGGSVQSPSVRSASFNHQHGLQLRMMNSEAGGHAEALPDQRSQASGSAKIVPYKLLNFEYLEVKDVVSNISSSDY